MKEKLKQQLREARPTLRVVSPLAHWVVVIMAVFNLILGAALFLAVDQNRVSAPLLIVNEILTFKIWGALFFAIGLLKLYSIKVNDWNLSRKTLLMGVSVKAMWAVALTIRSIVSPGSIFLNLLWVTVAALQMATYIWFMPPQTTLAQDKRLG